MKRFKMNSMVGAFSLMEMMVVLLIVSIIAAASAPMVTKKMARDAIKSGGGPVLATASDTAVLPNMSLLINAINRPPQDNNSQLYVNGQTRIDGNLLVNTILPSNGNNNISIGNAQSRTTINGDATMNGDLDVMQDITTNGDLSITQQNGNSIRGIFAHNNGQIDSIGVPLHINTAGNSGDIQIGNNIGSTSNITLSGNTVIDGTLQLAEGRITDPNGNTIIQRKNDGTIILGAINGMNTVIVPGRFVVGLQAYIGANHTRQSLWTHVNNVHNASLNTNGDLAGWIFRDINGGEDSLDIRGGYVQSFQNAYGKSYLDLLSDRRLKNVGEKYTAGLEELKKLDFFHFTFKKDETKRAQVGVMAQDLQKVFPDAVKEGDDGYLMIRWDDMFYAVINAIKQLDEKIAKITEDIKSNFDKTAKMEATISEQQKTIEAQQELINDLAKRVSKLEKKAKKNQE